MNLKSMIGSNPFIIGEGTHAADHAANAPDRYLTSPPVRLHWSGIEAVSANYVQPLPKSESRSPCHSGTLGLSGESLLGNPVVQWFAAHGSRIRPVRNDASLTGPSLGSFHLDQKNQDTDYEH